MKVWTLCLVLSVVLLACLVTEGHSLFFSVRKATSSVIRGARKGARAVGGAAKKGARVVGGAAKKGAMFVGGAAKKGVRVVGGAARKGAMFVGGAAKKGARVVGDAAKKGARFVGGAAKKGARVVGGAALGTRDMYGRYRDMKKANWKKYDKYFHARANYDAARHGPGGRWAARVISNARENWQSGVSGRGAEDTSADQVANRWGRNGGNPNRYRPRDLPEEY